MCDIREGKESYIEEMVECIATEGEVDVRIGVRKRQGSENGRKQ